jgi:hypothetical protein
MVTPNLLDLRGGPLRPSAGGQGSSSASIGDRVGGEFLGPSEEHGWSLAGVAIPILYIAWSVWLLAMGSIALVA